MQIHGSPRATDPWPDAVSERERAFNDFAADAEFANTLVDDFIDENGFRAALTAKRISIKGDSSEYWKVLGDFARPRIEYGVSMSNITPHEALMTNFLLSSPLALGMQLQASRAQRDRTIMSTAQYGKLLESISEYRDILREVLSTYKDTNIADVEYEIKSACERRFSVDKYDKAMRSFAYTSTAGGRVEVCAEDTWEAMGIDFSRATPAQDVVGVDYYVEFNDLLIPINIKNRERFASTDGRRFSFSPRGVALLLFPLNEYVDVENNSSRLTPHAIQRLSPIMHSDLQAISEEITLRGRIPDVRPIVGLSAVRPKF